jgi:hypothetical protein
VQTIVHELIVLAGYAMTISLVGAIALACIAKEERS